MLVAPRIGNDVSYVTRIDDASHFAWQAQHLVMLEDHLTPAVRACCCELPASRPRLARKTFQCVGGYLMPL